MKVIQLKDAVSVIRNTLAEGGLADTLELRMGLKAKEFIEPKWIPVTERLPEDYVTVMATVEGYVEPEARYSKRDGWEWAYESGTGYWEELDGVIAWMPLPEPYKEGE